MISIIKITKSNNSRANIKINAVELKNDILQFHIRILLTISKATQTVHSWHFNNKCKYIINKCIQTFIRHHSPRKMCHRLELIVNEQLWSHCNETCKNIIEL